MTETLTSHLTVATCIGCGRRNRAGECPQGCPDVPLDLVDDAALQALAAATEARAIRIAPLQELAETVAAGAAVGWPALQDRARAALRLPAPNLPDIEIIQAWGCPRCGRIDERRERAAWRDGAHRADTGSQRPAMHAPGL